MTTTTFDVRTANQRALNSMTKYPSIPTYHTLDKSNGGLLDEVTKFDGEVIGTEKIDGTNARLILLPDGTYIIGSREELLYGKGDLIGGSTLGIADALRPLANDLKPWDARCLWVLYLEVYGSSAIAGWKNYGKGKHAGWRLFDAVTVFNYDEILDMPIERIASWRDHGGQQFCDEVDLEGVSRITGVDLAPRLFTIPDWELPTSVEETYGWLGDHITGTLVSIDGTVGEAEGIVLRSSDRSTIAKARFQDYERTLRRRGSAK